MCRLIGDHSCLQFSRNYATTTGQKEEKIKVIELVSLQYGSGVLSNILSKYCLIIHICKCVCVCVCVCVCYLVSYHMVDFEEKNCFEGPNVGATI